MKEKDEKTVVALVNATETFVGAQERPQLNVVKKWFREETAMMVQRPSAYYKAQAIQLRDAFEAIEQGQISPERMAELLNTPAGALLAGLRATDFVNGDLLKLFMASAKGEKTAPALPDLTRLFESKSDREALYFTAAKGQRVLVSLLSSRFEARFVEALAKAKDARASLVLRGMNKQDKEDQIALNKAIVAKFARELEAGK